ncbi:MAG: hypothetical protein U1A27_07855 [Phycisphaerae bacterium]
MSPGESATANPPARNRTVPRARRGAMLLARAAACLVVGTLWHELVGHGLVGVALGGRIESADVLGVQVWPRVAWGGWKWMYGHCNVSGVPAARDAWVNLGGSLSTFTVGVTATLLLRRRRWGRAKRRLLAWLSIWWLDLFRYSLPALGLPAIRLLVPRYSEPFEAARELGMPGAGYIALLLCSALLLARATIRHARAGAF